MGLKATFQNAALTAFKAAGDVVEPVLYRSAESGQYDAKQDVRISQDVDVSWRGIFVEYNRYEIDEHVFPSDLKFIGLYQEAKAAGITPTRNAYIVRNGVELAIVRVTEDPAQATYELQLRAANSGI